MKFLHTSDWHLGRKLYGKTRYEEFKKFLDWLADILEEGDYDALLVSGDVFDTGTPSNTALELYFNFLAKVAKSKCKYVVIIAGNHDSPKLLASTKNLLAHLEIYVVGQITDIVYDEIILLNNKDNTPEAIVCAVPFLRDRDIRDSEPGESIKEKAKKLKAAIKDHYKSVVKAAIDRRDDLGLDIPIIAMGHLFTVGGKVVEGDGVRELYVGSLAHVNSSAFPKEVGYLALGHLHSSQVVSKDETKRYSGAPIPMNFNEAGHKKAVLSIDYKNKSFNVKSIQVPTFQAIETIKGDIESIKWKLGKVMNQSDPPWIEVIYEGAPIIGSLQETIKEITTDSNIEILRIVNTRIEKQSRLMLRPKETLDDLNEKDVFTRCMDANNVPVQQRKNLYQAFDEILLSITESPS